jgi:type IV pilus assembly protein PilA
MKTKGFTLLELLVVIAIIGILAATLIPNLLAARQKANLSAAQQFTRNVTTVTETLRLQDGTFDVLAVGTDCASVAKGFPAKPAVIDSTNSCQIAFNTSKVDYVINAKLVEAASGTGNLYYTYDSRTMQSKPQASAIAF